MSSITFENKENLNNNTSIPSKNKITAEDINEIKRIVNEIGNATITTENAQVTYGAGSGTLQLTKIDFHNGIVALGCSGKETSCAITGTGNTNLKITFPTSFTSIYCSAISTSNARDGDSYQRFSSITNTGVDCYITRALDRSAGAIVNMLIIGSM